MVGSAVQTNVTRGYQPPLNIQFSVFLDMRVGRLLELLDTLAGHALSLAALSVVDASDHAVVRVLTSRSELARRVLERHQLPFAEANVLVVELAGEQTLSGLCTALVNAELNIHYTYPLLVRPRGHAAIAVHVDDYILAGQVLRRQMFTLFGENDLGENAAGSDPGNVGPQN